jgi:hypothetical protein
VPITIETSPALVSGDSSVTTASFTRPAGGLLVAMVGANTDDAPVVSGGSLTWTRRVQRVDSAVSFGEIWTAPCPTAGSMTVTAAVTGDFMAVGLKVIALSGQDSGDPIGASGAGGSSTNNLTVTGYVSTVAGSRGFFAALNGADLAGTPTSTDTGFGWSVGLSSFDLGGINVYKAANTATSGTSVAFNADAPGSGSVDWQWAALEIKPALDGRSRAFVSRAAAHRAASW